VLWPFDAPNPQTPNRYLRAAGRITSLAEATYWPAVAMVVQWRWSSTRSTSLIVVPGMVFTPGGWLVVPYVFVLKNNNGAVAVPAAALVPDPLPDPQPGPETPPTAWSFLMEWSQEPGLGAQLYVGVGTPNDTTPYTMFGHRFYLSGHEAALLDGETGPLPEPDYVGLFVPLQLINDSFGIEVPAGEITLLGSGRFINGSFTNAASPAQAWSQADSPLEWIMASSEVTKSDLCDVKLQDGPLLRGIRDGFVRGEQVGC
jgi:hypothetical protein